MAILVAVVSWPFNVPTMRRRMLFSSTSSRRPRRGFLYPMSFLPQYALQSLRAFRVDDFRHGDAELVLHQHHLAARHQAVVDINVDGLADPAVELEHGAGPEFKQIGALHLRAAEHGRDLHRHVEDRLEIGGNAGSLFVFVVGDAPGRRGLSPLWGGGG